MAFNILLKSVSIPINKRSYRKFLDFYGFRFTCQIESHPYDDKIEIFVTESLNRKDVLSPEDISLYIKQNRTILVNRVLLVDERIQSSFFINNYYEIRTQPLEFLFEQKCYI